MTRKTELLDTTLKARGYSVTKTREVVYLALVNQEPLSMSALADKIVPAIDRASVYRTIKLFEQLGIVQKLYIGWKYKIELSNKFSHHHHHIVCVQCGRIKAFQETKHIDSELNTIVIKAGYKPVSHQIELSGICKSCQEKNAIKTRTPAV